MITSDKIPIEPYSHKKCTCICDICGEAFVRTFRNITKSREKYNTDKDYCKRCCYDIRSPKKEIVCIICKKSFIVGDTKANKYKKYCSLKCSNKGRVGSKRSKESRELMSKACKGRIPWNKGKRASEDSRILAGERSPSFGKTYMTKINNPEWAKKISDSFKGKINLGDKNGMKKISARNKVSNSRKEMFKNKKIRKEYSEKTKQAWKDGKFDGVSVGKCKWYKYKKIDGTIIKCQGTWELAFAKWADQNGLNFDTHKGRIPYTDENGEERSYYPDFFVYDWNEYIDIKSDYYWELHKSKFDLIWASNNNITITVLKKQDLANLGIVV